MDYSVSKLASDIVGTYGDVVRAADADDHDSASVTGLQSPTAQLPLMVHFEANLHRLPLVRFRPPNHPNKFSAALLRHFNHLYVRAACSPNDLLAFICCGVNNNAAQSRAVPVQHCCAL
jgi:hypothetical protein